MRKIKFNRHTLLSLVATCAALTSCTTSEDVSPNVEPTDGDSKLTCEAKGKEFADLDSRSSLSFDKTTGMVFKWNAGDAITVFAKGDESASQIYRLTKGEQNREATFYAKNFNLKAGQFYYAFSKEKGGNATNVTINSYNDIVVNYKGQTQIDNANTNHLGDYDFQSSGILCENPNEAHFQFSSLGVTLRLLITIDKTSIIDEAEKKALDLKIKDDELSPIYFTDIELFDKKNQFCQTRRNFSFDSGTSETEGVVSYTAVWPTLTPGEMDRFKLHLNSDPQNPLQGGITRFDAFHDGSGDNTNGNLVAYIELPPHTFPYIEPANSGNNCLNFKIKGYYEKMVDDEWVKIPVSYTYEYKKAFALEQGKAHQINVKAQQPEEFKVTLKVNHTWQHGDVVDDTTVSPAKSRATGDPGNDKKIHLPKYIYYIYCHDGKVVKPSYEIGADAVTKITATESSAWNTERIADNDISTYIGNNGALDGVVTLTKYLSDEPGHDAHDGDCTYHLYVVASESELSLSASLGQSEETLVRELKYNIPGSNAQVFMRDLYSTPWDATHFEGNLTTKNQDITLYHVAAMVDVKWNTNTTAITSVSANDVKSQGLFLFKPTENTTAKLGDDTGYTATNSVEADQSNLGRTVFYLPQFKAPNCQYKIDFNESGSPETVTFTPDVTKGYTSWLRWLKKKN